MFKFLIMALSIHWLLVGCAAYKIDVQQGNIVTQEMLDQLQPNMPAQKVRFILGTPMLVDTFHPQRWGYLYSLQRGSSQREQRRITVVFDKDLLVGIEGDVVIKARLDKQKLSPPQEKPGPPEPIL